MSFTHEAQTASVAPAASAPAQRQATRAAVALFFIAPALAELLSGSTPPREYFFPITFVVMHTCYGALAVLLREWALRCGLNTWGRVVLALVVGIFVEGIVCKSLFSPLWPDFSFPLGYGRLWGVNWPWLVNLLLYHGLNSFLIPWLLVDLLFPQARATPALGRRSMLWLSCCVLLTGILGWTFMPMNPQTGAIYYPGWLAAVLCWSALVLIPLLAARLPRITPAVRRLAPHPYLVGWAVGLGWFAFFVRQYGWVTLWYGPLLAIALSLILVAVALGLVWRWHGTFTQPQHFAVLAGSTWFWALLAIIQEMDNAKRADDTRGMAVLGGLALGGLFVLRQYLLRRQAVLAITAQVDVTVSQ